MSQPPAFIAEQHVQLAAQHFIRRGQTVYDVGANRGWLAVSFSKLVGTQGHVSCFEASPRNIDILSDLAFNYHLTNIEVIGSAIYAQSGLTLNFFENPFSNTDSLYFEGQDSHRISVSTLALDDYFDCTGLRPSVMKMDIEGAEYDALLGASRLIDSCHPIVLLEIRKEDIRPFRFLVERGYCAYNLKTFDRMQDEADFEAGGLVEDLLLVHESSLQTSSSAFLSEAARHVFATVDPEIHYAERIVVASVPVEAGISCVRIYAEAVGNPSVACSVIHDGRVVVRSDAHYNLICEPHFSFTLYSAQAGTASVCMQVVSNDPNPQILRAEVKTIPLDEDNHRHHKTLKLIQPFGAPIEEVLPVLEELINQGLVGAFECLADQLRRTHPRHPRLLYLSGVNAMHTGRMESAVAIFDEALAVGFDVFWTNYMKASASLSLGRTAEAIRAAEAAEKASPGHPEILRILNRAPAVA